MTDSTTPGFEPTTNPKAAAKAAKAYAKATRPWFRKKRWWAAGVLAALVVGTSLGGQDGQPTEATTADKPPAAATEKAAAKAEQNTKPKKPSRTLAQEQAVRAAENYLETMPFSRQGLIDQLSSEYGSDFALADAKYAVRAIEVDWNEQAVRAAENYLETMPFSRQGLIDQLSSEHGSQFTRKQATHAVTKLGL